MRKGLKEIKQDLEEHLTSINDNTSEIQSLFDYLHQVEQKIDKLSQRLDQVQLNEEDLVAKQPVMSLNQLEKKVFLVLYTEETPISCKEIALKVELPVSLVAECVSSLAHKGIPFARSFVHNQQFLKIDPVFKELQAKENLVNLSLQSFME